MRYTHSGDYINKISTDIIDIEYDYTNDIGSDTLASAVVTITDSNGTDTTTAMISNTTVVSPDVFFKLSAGTVNTSYSIKIIGTTTSGKVYTGYLNCQVFGSITLNSKLGDSNANSYVTLTQANEIISNKYGHLNLWDDLTEEGKNRVLIQATRDIDNNNFIKTKYYTNQNLQFPRSNHETVIGDCATPFTKASFINSNLFSTTYNTYPQDYWKYGSCHITVGTPAREIGLIKNSSATNGNLTLYSDLTATPNANTDFLVFGPIDKMIQEAQCEQALHILQTNTMSTLKNYAFLNSSKVKIGDVEVTFKNNSNSNSQQIIAPIVKKLISKYIDNRFYVYRA